MTLVVQKYGGTSLATVERVKTVAAHIAAAHGRGEKLVIVVSAMGDETNRLSALARELSARPSPRELDVLLTAGERVSMSLMSMALHDLKVPSVSLTGSQSGILTDTNHGNAKIIKILGERIRENLQNNSVVIVAGFQGMAIPSKNISTLGRGGSDLTAVALSAALEASLCEIYTDVPGVFNADPREFDGAKHLQELHWSDLLQLAWHGAAVVHSRAAQLAYKKRIPLVIRSSFDFDTEGTKVMTERPTEDTLEAAEIVAITSQKSLARVEWRLEAPKDVSQWYEKISAYMWGQGDAPIIQDFQLKGNELQVEIVGKAAHLTAMLEAFDAEGAEVQEHLACIVVVGSGFWQDHQKSADVLKEAHTKGRVIRFCKTNEALKLVLSEKELAPCLAHLQNQLLS